MKTLPMDQQEAIFCDLVDQAAGLRPDDDDIRYAASYLLGALRALVLAHGSTTVAPHLCRRLFDIATDECEPFFAALWRAEDAENEARDAEQ